MKNKKENFKLIVVCILLFVAIITAFYLIGLIHQVFANYMEWNAKGGFLNDEYIKPVNWGVATCLSYAFSSGGIKLALIIAIGVGGVILYFKYKDIFNGNKRDPRGFIISKNGTHGTAELMGDKELKSILCKGKAEDADGTIIGKKGGQAVWIPNDTRLNGHVAVFGASGSMKSRAVIRNALFQSIKKCESVVVTDLKGELYEDTAKLFKDNGYKIRVFNLANPSKSDAWNCLSRVGKDLSVIHSISKVIMQNTSDGAGGDKFWESVQENLLNALILYVCNDNSRTEEKNIGAVYEILSHSSEIELMQMFEMYSKRVGVNEAFEFYKKSVENVRASAVSSLGTRLNIWQLDAIKKITKTSDIDLTALAKEKCVYFVRLQDIDHSYTVLSSLFFSCLFIELSKYISEHYKSTLPINFILDEFNNIGKIGGGGGLDFAQTISTCRSNRISIMIVSQSLGQLENRYPDKIWQEILGNCDVQLLLGCNDLATAEYFSDSAGMMSVENDAYMTTKKTLSLTQMYPEYRQTQSTIMRRVLTMDEVRRMPRKHLICLIRGQNVLILDKLDYVEHPMAQNIQKKNIDDYMPIRKIVKLKKTERKAEENLTCGYAELSSIKISYTGSKPPEDF